MDTVRGGDHTIRRAELRPRKLAEDLAVHVPGLVAKGVAVSDGSADIESCVAKLLQLPEENGSGVLAGQKRDRDGVVVQADVMSQGCDSIECAAKERG